MKRIGERIKKKRTEQAMPLYVLAGRVGVTSSCLSQIENRKAFPSIPTLKKVADALHTTVGELIGEKETLAFNPLTRASERKFVKESPKGIRLYLVSHHDPHKLMETYHVEFKKNADSSQVMVQHPGQEFCFILQGRLQVTLNRVKHLLAKGDYFYFNSNEPHLFKNIHNGKSEMLWVVTPPDI